MSQCQECGMLVKTSEYHPYAACLLFKVCGNANEVRAHLQGVIEHARRTAPDREAWQPIETAPKDEVRIWACFPFANQAYPVCWRQNVYEKKFNWTLDDGESATLTYDAPTHWMPLPVAPTSALDRLAENARDLGLDYDAPTDAGGEKG